MAYSVLSIVFFTDIAATVFSLPLNIFPFCSAYLYASESVAASIDILSPNAFSLIIFTVSGTLIILKSSQPANAFVSIVFNPFSKNTCFNAVQS